MSEMIIMINYFAIFYVNEIKTFHLPQLYTNIIFFDFHDFFINKSIQICSNGIYLILYSYTFTSKLYFHIFFHSQHFFVY